MGGTSWTCKAYAACGIFWDNLPTLLYFQLELELKFLYTFHNTQKTNTKDRYTFHHTLGKKETSAEAKQHDQVQKLIGNVDDYCYKVFHSFSSKMPWFAFSSFQASPAMCTIQQHHTSLKENNSVVISWTNDSFQNVYLLESSKPHICHIIPNITIEYHFCLNFSSDFMTDTFSKLVLFGFSNFSEPRMSWMKSSDMCTELGAYLPVLLNREDTFNIASFIKYLPYQIHIQSLAIGLQSEQNYLQHSIMKKWQNYDPVAYQEWMKNVSSFKYHVRSSQRLKRGSTEEMCSGQPWKSVQTCDPNNLNCNCSALLLINLAEPKWTQIPCNSSFFKYVACKFQVDHKILKQLLITKPRKIYCIKNAIFLDEECYLFSWEILTHKEHHCFYNITKFEYLFDAIANKIFPPIIGQGQSVFLVSKFATQVTYDTEVRTRTSGAFCIKPRTSQHQNIFSCDNEAMISALYFCDDIQDCPGSLASDEQLCKCNNTENTHYLCKHMVSSPSQECSPLFYKSHSGECHTFVFEDRKSIVIESETSTVPLSKEEIHQSTEMILPDCYPRFHIPCGDESEKCYNISDVCSYALNKAGSLVPCRMGEHLQQYKEFQCNEMFKCPGHYCVAWHFVCDVKWDCPQGHDESVDHNCGPHRPCVGLFKCRICNICIHLESVCDNEKHCILGDDEALCSLDGVSCPLGCNCLTFALSCQQLNSTDDFTLDHSFKIIHIQYSDVQRMAEVDGSNFVSFHLVHTNLAGACQIFIKLTAIKLLDLGENEISGLIPNCFKNARKAIVIKLNTNLISVLQENVFNHLEHMKALNLSSNPISSIFHSTMKHVENLRVISFMNISSIDSHHSFFLLLSLEILEADNYKFCCLVETKTSCSMSMPWYVSCTDLLKDKSLKVTFYCMSTIIVMVNVLSILLQKIEFSSEHHNTKANVFLIVFLNVSDLFCSFPLITLWIADLCYKGIYIFVDELWRTGAACYITFCSSLFFAFLSPSALCLLSTARFRIVASPITTKFKDRTFVLKAAGLVLFASFCLSLVLTLVTWPVNHYLLKTGLPNNLCSPFLDPLAIHISIRIWTWFAALFQIMSVSFILVCYAKMFIKVQESQKSVNDAVSRKRSSSMLTIHIIIVTVSNIVCWIPCCIVYITSMFLPQYPVQMMFWIVVTVTPVNSIVNPSVFIVIEGRKWCQSKQ